jgi:hypothetical protein
VAAALKAIQPTWVFHLAAYGAYSWQTDEAQMQLTNVLGTRISSWPPLLSASKRSSIPGPRPSTAGWIMRRLKQSRSGRTHPTENKGDCDPQVCVRRREARRAGLHAPAL